VPGYFIYQLDPASFTPLHLVSKSAKFIPMGFLICTGLASIGIALYCAARLKKGSNNFPIAIFLSLAPMLLMASIGELAYGQWDIAGWAGANYLIPLIPLAAYLLIDITQGRQTYQGAHD
jgi:predicted membrane channel-forming protein YqfA (hemolysin III family)